MKQIKIDETLFVDLVHYFLMDHTLSEDCDLHRRISLRIEDKLNSLADRQRRQEAFLASCGRLPDPDPDALPFQ